MEFIPSIPHLLFIDEKLVGLRDLFPKKRHCEWLKIFDAAVSISSPLVESTTHVYKNLLENVQHILVLILS